MINIMVSYVITVKLGYIANVTLVQKCISFQRAMKLSFAYVVLRKMYHFYPSQTKFDIAVIKGVNYLYDELETESQTPYQYPNYCLGSKRLSPRGTPGEDEDDAGQPPECSYYTTDEFQKTNFDNRSFFILHLNVDSIGRHIE